ncbi:NAD(P)-dependent oxidoreductase [Aurantimonas endophytica]|uniref:3-hydroxyisobutyrate dehydrogenase-like beta-hydroxyacid dehydrogenase n=1 Tax=Aurantimonas endophytica TaxID=1522175 RepID=A0A7W6HG83_9HYPH|nr:NAD(P)-dependent oxidoreductase [Aurantimonas endophytica]MBB4004614.1 3-hydroxyisobutyrate dehydrogenase-like beta-hydroxyacid dehydrogenase [Aurantimonas endophytica]MCO6405447.1 NAD-binding protein [Aurantimonas endophytica]
MHIGFIGLGSMGRAMARNLIKAGHDVSAWNRTALKPEAAHGITTVDGPEEAFQAEVVFTMLSDDAAIRGVVLEGALLDGARAELIHVVTSTISIAFAEELAARHEEAGVGFVSAPVLGRPDVAARGELNMLVGGKVDAITAIKPLLAVLSKKVWQLGEIPAQANAAKIAANMMIAMAIEAMAEGVALTESVGLERARFFELILGTLFAGRAYESYSAQITEGAFKPGFQAKLGLKDLRLATEAGSATGRSLPMLDAVRERLSDAVSAGLGERDWSIMADVTLRGGNRSTISAAAKEKHP